MKGNNNLIKIKNMTPYDVVKKLIGPIEPLGDASRDYDRLENLEQMALLAELIISDIEKVSQRKDSYEGTVKQIGLRAQKCLTDIKEICEFQF